jgi:hypothetical protein
MLFALQNWHTCFATYQLKLSVGEKSVLTQAYLQFEIADLEENVINIFQQHCYRICA